MSSLVSIFVPSMEGGGAERVMAAVANGLAERGHAVDLVLCRATGPYLRDLARKVNVVDLQRSGVLSSFRPFVKYLRNRRPRAVLSTLDHANVVALLARSVAGVRTRSIVRLANVLSQSVPPTGTLRAYVTRSLIRALYPRADAVVAVSEGVAEDAGNFTGIPQEKVAIINNPVDISGIGERAQEPIAEEWFDAGEPPVILGVGRLTRQKDFATLIRAFDRVRKERAARLVILGEGEEREKLEALIVELGLEQDVLLPGFKPNPYAYMARASVFVLSSRWEGFPNVLVEAMATGTPVVATDCQAGPREILKDGRYGALVRVGDYNELAAAIVAELDKPPGQKTDVQARAKEFSPEAIVCQYERVLFGEGPAIGATGGSMS